MITELVLIYLLPMYLLKMIGIKIWKLLKYTNIFYRKK